MDEKIRRRGRQSLSGYIDYSSKTAVQRIFASLIICLVFLLVWTSPTYSGCESLTVPVDGMFDREPQATMSQGLASVPTLQDAPPVLLPRVTPPMSVPADRIAPVKITATNATPTRNLVAPTPALESDKPPPGTRYIIYDSSYGSLNNQLNSLVSALTIAHKVRAVTVLGPAFSPSGASKLRGDDDRVLFLGTDFLDRSQIEARQRIMTWDEFQATADGKKLKTPGFAKYLFVREEERQTTVPRYYNRILGLKPWAYKLNTRSWAYRESRAACRGIFDKANLVIKQCGSHDSCRFILLDRIFTNYYDCTHADPYWREIRKALTPAAPIRRTVDDFIAKVPRPIIAAHVRFAGALDGAGEQFWRKLSMGIDQALEESHHPSAATIYVLGMKRADEQFRVDNTILHLKNSWAKKHPATKFTFATCANVTNCGESGQLAPWAERLPVSTTRHLFQPQTLIQDTNCHYGTILLEEWLSVNADAYIGRRQSTFSQSVAIWRSQLHNTTVVNY